MILQVRFHGRGGQGVVTGAELLSVAAFGEGRYAQAIPSFGSERMGAPVVAFCRIADHPIRTHEPVVAPDVVVVGDATLMHHVYLFSGLSSTGMVLINSSQPPAALGLMEVEPAGTRHLAAIPATELGRQYVGRPVPNAALLGGLCALTEAVSLEAVHSALRARFAPPVGEGNVAAATAGFEFAKAQVAPGSGPRGSGESREVAPGNRGSRVRLAVDD